MSKKSCLLSLLVAWFCPGVGGVSLLYICVCSTRSGGVFFRTGLQGTTVGMDDKESSVSGQSGRMDPPCRNIQYIFLFSPFSSLSFQWPMLIKSDKRRRILEKEKKKEIERGQR